MRFLALLLIPISLLNAQIGTKSIVPLNVSRKVALVIGNSNYSRLEAIPAAGNDADDMASTLRRFGFEVSVKKNLGVEPLITEIAAFSQSVHPGDLALLYYSGHGGSVGEENYLLPVDYDPPARRELVDLRAYAMSKVRDVMEQSGARVRVMIFDACRGPAISAKGGDAVPRPIEGKPEGTLIAFASAHKQDALFDASKRNSIYTGALLSALNNRGSGLAELLQEVQRRVYEDTGHEQTPYLYGFLSAPLYLNGVGPIPGAITAEPKLDAARETWALIKDSQNAEDFEEFARSYPGSDLAPGARIRAAQLRRRVAPVVPGETAARAEPPRRADSPAPGDDGSKAPSSRASGSGPKSQAEQRAVQALLSAMTPDEVIKAAEALIEKYPTTDFKSFALEREGEAWQQKGDNTKAVTFGGRALVADPLNFDADNLVANVVAAATKATDLDKDAQLAIADGYARNSLSILENGERPWMYNEAQWPKVKAAAESQSYQALGNAALVRKNNDEAIANFQKGIDANPDPVLMIRVSRALAIARRWQDAISWDDRAISSADAPEQIKNIARGDKIRYQQQARGLN